jgi:hypothetical protein
MADERAVFTSRRVDEERDVVNDQSFLAVCDPGAQRMGSHERMENRDVAFLEMLRRVHSALTLKANHLRVRGCDVREAAPLFRYCRVKKIDEM